MEWDELMAKSDRESGITHRDGVPWYDAPIPRRLHRCTTWTTGPLVGYTIYRCACGGVRFVNAGPWIQRNTRTRG